MAEVTGTIGNEYVELNNAATEATLKAILTAIQGARKSNTDEIRRLAERSGVAGAATINPSAIAATNTGLTGIGQKLGGFASSLVTTGSQVGKAFSNFGEKLLEGTAQASDMFAGFAMLPGPIGKVAEAFRLLSVYQEQNMKTYQQISSAGINFAGELTALRTAMGGMRLTQEEFSAFMKNNSESLSRFGKNANDGAKNFAALSTALQEGEVGVRLKALGLTSEQVNSGLASFIAASGGRTRQEMQNTEQLTKSAKAYFEQLDALAQITGETREEQEAQANERKQNESFQNYLQTLSAEERAKAEASLSEARQRGGKGAEQALMARIMGLPPMTPIARKFEAFATNAGQSLDQFKNAVFDSSKSVKDIGTLGPTLTGELLKDAKSKAEVLRVLSLQGGDNAEIATALLKAQNKATNQGIIDEKTAREQLAEIREEQTKRELNSQARDQATLKQALEDLRLGIMKVVNPLVELFSPLITKIGVALRDILNPALTGLGNFIKESMIPFFRSLGVILDEKVLPIFKDMWTTISSAVQPWLKAMGSILESVVYPIFVKVGDYLGTAFMFSLKAIKEILDYIAPPFKFLGEKIDSAAKGFKKLDDFLGGTLTSTIAGLITALLAWKAALIIKDKFSSSGAPTPPGGPGGGGLSILNRRGYTPDKPLYVQMVRGLPIPERGARAGGGAGGRPPTGGSPAGAPPSPGGGTPSRPTGGAAGGAAGGAGGAGGAAGGAGGAAGGAGGAGAAGGAAGGAGAAGAGGIKPPARFLNILKTLKGIPGLSVLVASLDAINVALSKGEYQSEAKFYEDLTASIASGAGGAGGAVLGSALGTILFPGAGTLAGGMAGWMAGSYGADWMARKLVNWIQGGETAMAAGGIVTGPTRALIGEAGQPEVVLPLDRLAEMIESIAPKAIGSTGSEGATMPGDVSSTSNKSLESLHSELQRLNSISSETLKYIKETAEYTRRTVDATKELSGDLF